MGLECFTSFAFFIGMGRSLWQYVVKLLPHSRIQVSQRSILEHQMHFSDAISPHHFVNHPQYFTSTGIRDRLPPAKDKPFFYVGVYALIGFTRPSL